MGGVRARAGVAERAASPEAREGRVDVAPGAVLVDPRHAPRAAHGGAAAELVVAVGVRPRAAAGAAALDRLRVVVAIRAAGGPTGSTEELDLGHVPRLPWVRVPGGSESGSARSVAAACESLQESHHPEPCRGLTPPQELVRAQWSEAFWDETGRNRQPVLGRRFLALAPGNRATHWIGLPGTAVADEWGEGGVV